MGQTLPAGRLACRCCGSSGKCSGFRAALDAATLRVRCCWVPSVRNLPHPPHLCHSAASDQGQFFMHLGICGFIAENTLVHHPRHTMINHRLLRRILPRHQPARPVTTVLFHSLQTAVHTLAPATQQQIRYFVSGRIMRPNQIVERQLIPLMPLTM